MTDGGKQPEPPEEGSRTVENAVMAGFFVVLVAAGIWLLGTMADLGSRDVTAVTLAFKERKGFPDLGGRDRIHFLLRCQPLK
jgi:hypothetical protein